MLQCLRIHGSAPRRGADMDDGGDGDEVDFLFSKEVPISRQVVDSLRTLYRHHGMGIFWKGVRVAGLYYFARYFFRVLLKHAIFCLTGLYFPFFTDILNSVFAFEFHPLWTLRTVLSAVRPRRQPPRHMESPWTLKNHRQSGDWLLIPSAAHATASALLRYICKPLQKTPGASPSIEMIAVASGAIVRFAVLRAFFALVIHSLVLMLLSVYLFMIEASFLVPGQETLVYSHEKKRLLRAEEILGDLNLNDSRREGNMPLSLSSAFARARKRGWLLATCLKLLELHVKKCVVQMALEGLSLTIMWFLVI